MPALLAMFLVTLVLGMQFMRRLDGELQGLARSALAALLLNANHYDCSGVQVTSNGQSNCSLFYTFGRWQSRSSSISSGLQSSA